MREDPVVHSWRRARWLILAALGIGFVALSAYGAVAWVAADRWLKWESPPQQYVLSDFQLDVDIVEFPSRTGDMLSGWFVAARPPGDGAGCPAGTTVVLLHGFSDRKESLLPHTEVLHRQGCSVLLFDFSGSGDSDGAYRTVGVRAQQDLLGGLDHLDLLRPDGRKQQVAVMGISMGAVVAIHSGADERVGAVIAEAPYSDYPSVFGGWLRGRIGVAAPLVAPFSLRLMEWRSEAGVRSLSAVDAAAKLTMTPLFVIEGGLDGDVPTGSARAILDVAPETSRHWLVSDAGHGQGLASAPDEYERSVMEFLNTAFPDNANAEVTTSASHILRPLD